MGKREISTTTTRTVSVCDRCNKQADNFSLHRCDICKAEVGYCCHRLLLAYKSGDAGFLDLAFRVCTDCQEAGQDGAGPSFIDSIQAVVSQADKAVAELLERWRAWAKERDEQELRDEIDNEGQT